MKAPPRSDDAAINLANYLDQHLWKIRSQYRLSPPDPTVPSEARWQVFYQDYDGTPYRVRLRVVNFPVPVILEMTAPSLLKRMQAMPDTDDEFESNFTRMKCSCGKACVLHRTYLKQYRQKQFPQATCPCQKDSPNLRRLVSRPK